jgi:hypothetical protein
MFPASNLPRTMLKEHESGRTTEELIRKILLLLALSLYPGYNDKSWIS